MAKPKRTSGAGELIRSTQREATDLISLQDAQGRRAMASLAALLEEADRTLSRRLRREAARFGKMDARFTGASMVAYRAQIRLVLKKVRARLEGLTVEQSDYAVARSLRDTVRLLEGLERRFTGITRVVRLRQAQVMDPLRRNIRASLLRQHATVVDRYGMRMVAQFEHAMRVGLLMGSSQEEMIATLSGHGGPRGKVSLAARVAADGSVVRLLEERIPEGLFRRYRYWAARIVRTETAYAYSQAREESLFEARTQDFPDLQKKILAVFDKRTAADSIAVHGQVRELHETFYDGAGRSYLMPPARPNDRETVIPWRPHWRESETTKAPPVAVVARAREETRKGRSSAPDRVAARRAIASERAHSRREQARKRRSSRAA